MQNLPDKGVSGSLCYLWADYTVTGLTRMVLESQGGNERSGEAVPVLGLEHSMKQIAAPFWRNFQSPFVPVLMGSFSVLAFLAGS
jgi:hypothetical protein